MTNLEIRNTIDSFICKKHTGKMSGMQSFSTSVLMNATCAARAQDPDSICAHCFAERQLNRYGAQAAKLQRATEFITADVYPVDAFPVLNVKYFRLEAFGDLLPGKAGVAQELNYFHFCNRNPETTFAQWTKNPWIIRDTLKIENKPSNLIIIYSSLLLNQAYTSNDNPFTLYPFIDKVFTVYGKHDIKPERVNCGGRHCLSCLNCYKHNDIKWIKELLK